MYHVENAKEGSLLKVEWAAKYLGIPTHRLRYEIWKKRITHVKIGKSVFFRKADLDAWINKNIVVSL